jgi:hypothetical protein
MKYQPNEYRVAIRKAFIKHIRQLLNVLDLPLARLTNSNTSITLAYKHSHSNNHVTIDWLIEKALRGNINYILTVNGYAQCCNDLTSGKSFLLRIIYDHFKDTALLDHELVTLMGSVVQRPSRIFNPNINVLLETLMEALYHLGYQMDIRISVDLDKLDEMRNLLKRK